MICGAVATSISGRGVCTECRVVCDSHTTRHSVHIPRPETLVATTLQIIKRCIFTNQFHKKNCRFSKAQHKLPEDGPGGPKQVGVSIEIF